MALQWGDEDDRLGPCPDAAATAQGENLVKTLARRDDQLEIMTRLRGLDPGLAARWGRMSAHQMICHLSDAFRMALGIRAVVPRSGPLERSLLKWIVLYAPLKWPEARITTSPELDPLSGGTQPSSFELDLAELERLIERFGSPAARFDHVRHPIFGAMSQAAWMRWAYLHTDHHLRQFGV